MSTSLVNYCTYVPYVGQVLDEEVLVEPDDHTSASFGEHTSGAPVAEVVNARSYHLAVVGCLTYADGSAAEWVKQYLLR